jgi:hypothetical protein
MYQAIQTIFIGPTNTRPKRIKAKANAGSILVPWTEGLNVWENHAKARDMLCEKLGWDRTYWHMGGYGEGYLHVLEVTR